MRGPGTRQTFRVDRELDRIQGPQLVCDIETVALSRPKLLFRAALSFSLA